LASVKGIPVVVKERVFVAVPALVPTGPVKGAIALANAIARERRVTFVTLKAGPGADAPLDRAIDHVCLAGTGGGIWGKVRAYRTLLGDAAGPRAVASISSCFSADMVNRLCRREAVICASVRGNLMVNYKFDYGLAGVGLAMVHLRALKSFDLTVAMTRSMANQIRRFTGTEPAIVGNFIDETELAGVRQKPLTDPELRFVFLGSLTPRKQPLLVLHAIRMLRANGHNVTVDFIGEGPLLKIVFAEIRKHGLTDAVRLHGQVARPGTLLAEADGLVLPSLSEGVPRAALEALYLGVPCVLRKVDGNAEFIEDGQNGKLFFLDDELPGAMLAAAKLSRSRVDTMRPVLLPEKFRQHIAAQEYLRLVDSVE